MLIAAAGDLLTAGQVGGGTGWNIERMADFLPVNDFFQAVYVVDLSPSLCKVAEARFERLGWKNVKVICQDARYFRLADYAADGGEKSASVKGGAAPGVDLITLSFALSMIPEYYPVIDSLATLLGPEGIIGACDFYVQSQIDYRSRNYTGGVIDRHCNFWSRTFWRTFFEVCLEHVGNNNSR
jgi:betaine lipid synthase